MSSGSGQTPVTQTQTSTPWSGAQGHLTYEMDQANNLYTGNVGYQPYMGQLQAPEIVETIPNIDHRFGDGRAQIIGIAVLDEQGRTAAILEPSTRILVRISVRATADVAMPIVGFMLRNQLGMDFSGTNTAREGYELAPLLSGDITTVDFYIDLPELYPASFSFSPAIADGTLMGYQMCDWIDNAITLQMARSEAQVYGYLHLPCRVEVNARVRAERQLESHLG